MAMNLSQVQSRFNDLESTEDVIQGNGRLLIWESALPTIAEAGPFGVGSGGTIMAMRRNSSDLFGASTVDHLHQDVLQWILERGWIGALALALGVLVVFWLWGKRLRALDPPRRALCYAGLGGVAVLCAHGNIDLIWRSPALVLQAMLLLSVVAGAMARNRGSQSSLGMRCAVLALAAALLGALWWTAPVIRELGLVQRVERVILLRERSGAGPLRHPLVDEVLAYQAQTGELARLRQGWRSPDFEHKSQRLFVPPIHS